MYQKPKVLCILGPTASGKTDLSLKLAHHFPCDLISVDSAMVYRGLNIGSAKPNQAILKAYPHALIDICDPEMSYSAAEFRLDAISCIENSIKNHRLPVLVGGSMLYHHVLQEGMAELPPANLEIRAELQKQAELFGFQALHHRLSLIDPVAALRIHPNDPQRLLRALDVFYSSGKPLSQYWKEQENKKLPYEFVNIGLHLDRPELREGIAHRFLSMLEQGFIDEVRELYKNPNMHENLPAIKSVGYQQAWQYLQDKITYEQMKEQAINATRQFAKRQMTWLRSWPNLISIHAQDSDRLEKIKQALGI